MVAGAAALVVVAAVVLVWFQPQKLLIDETVEEAVPVAVGTAPPDDEPGPSEEPATTVTTGTVEVATGDFVSLDHRTSGKLRVLDLGNGSRVVRLEGLRTDNGPDLYLYVTANPVDGEEGAFDDDVVNLGRLKGNQGDQNYDLPAGVDLADYASVVIWCDRFDSAFGAAPLT
jgi:hypothetical protein